MRSLGLGGAGGNSKCYRLSVKYMYRYDGLGRDERERDGVSAKQMGVIEG